MSTGIVCINIPIFCDAPCHQLVILIKDVWCPHVFFDNGLERCWKSQKHSSTNPTPTISSSTFWTKAVCSSRDQHFQRSNRCFSWFTLWSQEGFRCPSCPSPEPNDSPSCQNRPGTPDIGKSHRLKNKHRGRFPLYRKRSAKQNSYEVIQIIEILNWIGFEFYYQDRLIVTLIGGLYSSTSGLRRLLWSSRGPKGRLPRRRGWENPSCQSWICFICPFWSNSLLLLRCRIFANSHHMTLH